MTASLCAEYGLVAAMTIKTNKQSLKQHKLSKYWAGYTSPEQLVLSIWAAFKPYSLSLQQSFL